MTARNFLRSSSLHIAGTPSRNPWSVLSVSYLVLGLLSACGGGTESADVAQPFSADGTANALAVSAKGADSNTQKTRVVPPPISLGTPTPSADGYYVNVETGADSNPGTIDLPWRSLARLKGVTLQPNEGFYLRCGQTWRESLVLGRAELVDNSVIAGYGPDCDSRKAVISGANVFSGQWQFANGVWSLALPAGTPKITQLFIDNQPLHKARWPNRDSEVPGAGQAGNSVLATATASHGILLRALNTASPAAQNLVGATVQLRTKPWLLETRKINAQSGATVRLDKATIWDVKAGQEIVLEDQFWMLDSPGEFFHDVQGQRLHVMALAASAPVNLNLALVEGSVRDIAFSAIERSRLVIRNIEVRAARVDGLRLTDTPQAQISRVEAHHNQGAGIRLWQWVPLPNAAIGQPGPLVADSLLTGNGEIGIDAQYVERTHIRGVVVKETGTGPQHTANVLAAIAAGPGGVISDSQVDGSGYIGIRFSSVGGSMVSRNTVSRYCLRLTDCGAIYTWNGNSYPSPATDSTVESNRVFGATPLDVVNVVAADDGSDVIAGVYVDDLSHGVTVRSNTIFGAPTGILVHNASRTTVTGNRIWLPSRVGIFATMDDRTVDTMVSNRFEGNQIAPLVTSKAQAGRLPEFKVAQAFWFWHWRDGAAALAAGRNSFANNAVIQFQGPLAAHAWLRGPGDERYIDSLEWQRLNTAELAVQRPLTFDALQVATGPELVQNGDFNAGLSSWRTWHHPTSTQFKALPFSTRPGCEGPCIDLTSGHGTDLLASAPFQMRPGVPYVYRWRAVMPTNSSASVAWPYISRETSPWDAMWNTQGFVGYTPRQGRAGDVLNYEIFFIPKSADAGRVNLQLDTPGISVGVDSISVREVTGYTVAKTGDWAAVAHAPASAPKTWNCLDLGWPAGCRVADEGGQSIEVPLTIAAGGIKFLVRTDSSFANRR